MARRARTPAHGRAAALVAVAAVLLLGACRTTPDGRTAGTGRAPTTAVGDAPTSVAGRTEPDSLASRRIDETTELLVPNDALRPGDTVDVVRTSAPGATDGAVVVASVGYRFTASGAVHRPLVLQTDVGPPGGRTVAVGLLLDDATGRWGPASSDVVDGRLAVYLTRPGTYGWARWDPDAAVTVAEEALRRVVGRSAGGDACGGAGAAPLAWCAAVPGGAPSAVNRAPGPRSLVVTGAAVATGPDATVLDGIADRVRDGADGAAAVDAVLPARSAAVLDTEPGTGASLVLRHDDLSRRVTALGATVAITLGLRVGTVERLAAVLRDRAALDPLLDDLRRPVCLTHAGTLAADEAADAAGAAALVRTTMQRCPLPALDAALARLDAGGPTAAGALGRLAAPSPETLDELARAVAPMLAGGPDARASVPAAPPDDPTTTASTSAPPGVPPAPPSTTAVPVPPPTAPPVGPTVTPTAPAVPPPTTPPTTPTAPPPTTPPVPTTVPAPALTVGVGPASCSSDPAGADGDEGGGEDDPPGSVVVRATGATPGGTVAFVFRGPAGTGGTTGATASPSGTAETTFRCTDWRHGGWEVTAADGATGRTSAPAPFQIRK